MIEQELGLSLTEIFSEISPEPVAAASLGQVHTFGLISVFFQLMFADFLDVMYVSSILNFIN